MTGRPEFLVLAGPSGAGKTTIANGLVRRDPERFAISVSVTTRPARAGERGGVEYRFLSRREFDAMVRAGELAEWAEVHGEYYGTPLRNLAGPEGAAVGEPAGSEAQDGAAGPVLVLDIDVQGARQLLRRSPAAVVMFVVPPGPGPWLRRLRGRGTESPRQIAARLATALRELEAAESLCDAPQFGGFVVNESLEGAVGAVAAAVARHGRPEDAREREAVRAQERKAAAEGARVRGLRLRLAEGARAEIARLERAGLEREGPRRLTGAADSEATPPIEDGAP